MEKDAEIEAPVPLKRPGKATGSPPTDKPVAAKENLATEAADLVALVTDKPAEVLLNGEALAKLYATIGKEVAAFKPDLSTQAGRDRIKSLAYKIVRTRTTLDAAGKDHTADLRAKIDGVNAVRAGMRDELEKLEALARKPLTDWEEAEAEKARKRGEILKLLSEAARAHMPAPDLKDLQVEVEAMQFDPELWGEDLQMVTDRQAEVVTMLDDRIQAAEAAQRAKIAEAEAEALRNAATPKTANQDPPTAAPVYDREELPPPIASAAPPAAEAGAKPLTPTQQARRRVLPVLLQLGVSEDVAKKLILAIEAGQLPGVTATYLEQTT